MAVSESPRSADGAGLLAASGGCAGNRLAKQLEIDGGRPLQGEVRISGAKNAALPIMAAALLTDQPCRLENVPRLADVENSIAILTELGATIDRGAENTLTITAAGSIGSNVPYERARVMRASILFMGPLLARNGEAILAKPGGDDIGMRRVDQHVAGMVQMGATVQEDEGNFICRAEHLTGADILLDMPTVTGTENLMMAATLADGQTTISNAAREPHIADLAHALNTMGARISGAGSDRIEVEGVARLGAGNHRVCPDYLEAGTYAIAVAATGGEVMLLDFPAVDLRSLVTKLRMAGVSVEVEAEGVRVRREGPIRPVDLITWTHPGFATDLQPQYTALMTQAAGTSVIQEFLFENRFNYVSELNALGANIELFPHRRGIRVHGPSALRGNAVTIPDIRAGAALMIGAMCAQGGTMLSGVEHLDRGYEDMAGKLSQLGAQVREGAVRAVDSPGEAIAGAE
ncbi:MAG: UDP-N-acetylglucosamine 1-carboxyvinyltransferase [Candidatus Dormiibacterota bacterium]